MALNELCGPCQELGLTTPAHYAGTSAGLSTSGKGIPPKCRWHHFGMPLPGSMKARIPLEKLVPAVVLNAPKSIPPAPVTEPAEPLKAQAGETKVTAKDRQKEKTMAKQCACGCGQEITERFTYAYGHKPKKTVESSKKKARKTKSRKAKRAIRAAASPGLVRIRVPVSHLDDWWNELPLEEKAAIFSRQFES